jgi:hypothetical protein
MYNEKNTVKETQHFLLENHYLYLVETSNRIKGGGGGGGLAAVSCTLRDRVGGRRGWPASRKTLFPVHPELGSLLSC